MFWKEGQTYHVFSRGVDKAPIFLDYADNQKFLFFLDRYKEKYHFTVAALCLMNNHFHILIISEKIPVCKIMQSVLSNYAKCFNKRYGRCGALFSSRYKWTFVKDEKTFLNELRYILKNPVKKGYVKTVFDYEYSSVGEISRSGPYSKMLTGDFNKGVKKFLPEIDVSEVLLSSSPNETLLAKMNIENLDEREKKIKTLFSFYEPGNSLVHKINFVLSFEGGTRRMNKL